MSKYKDNNPLQKIATITQPEPPQDTKEQQVEDSPQKQEETQPEPTKRKNGKKKYTNLDITGLEDYLEIMARYSKISQTKYIRKLIEADMEMRQDEFKKYKKIDKKIEKIQSEMMM